MSHWNLQVTIGNKDKEIMRGGVMLLAKWHLLTEKLGGCHKLQLRRGAVIMGDSIR